MPQVSSTERGVSSSRSVVGRPRARKDPGTFGNAPGLGIRPRRFARPRAKFNENPQNTENPVVVPDPSYDCLESVRVQLQSLQTPNEPWPNHATQMMYNFAYDVGGLDPSMYFAYPTDLYHLDHFMGKFANKLPDLLANQSFTIDGSTCTEPEDPDDFEATWSVEASVTGRTGVTESRVRFSMRRKRVGTYKNCLMTYMIETL